VAVRPLLLGLVLLGLAGCGSESGPQPVGRSAVKEAFGRAGEPLKVRLDASGIKSGSGARLDVIYVPVSADVEAPWEVAVFDNDEGARRTISWANRIAHLRVLRWKNVSLDVRKPIPRPPRQKLVATLKSL
jgi:hypothetical protein